MSLTKKGKQMTPINETGLILLAAIVLPLVFCLALVFVAWAAGAYDKE